MTAMFSPEPNLLGDEAPGERPSTFGAGGMYSASNMVDDIVREPTPAPAAKPAEAPAAAAAPTSTTPTPAPAPPGLALDAGAERLAPEGLPFGSHVTVAIERAAGDQGLDPAAIVSTWMPVFAHHAVSDTEASALIAAGQHYATNGPPSAETAAEWRQQAYEGLASDFGGTEGADRALKAAQAYCAKHPQMLKFLERTGLGDDPRVVRAVANAAMKARAAGKLG